MLLRLGLILTLSLTWLSAAFAAGNEFIDIPVNGAKYSKKDSIRVIANKNHSSAHYIINLRHQNSGIFLLDTLITQKLFSWAIPDSLSSGAYELTITDAAINVQIIEIEISKNHLADYYYEWGNVTYYGGFTPRDGAGLLKFKDKYWMLGGWNPLKYDTLTTSEVLSSSDGASWTIETVAPWEARHVVGWVIFKDSIWVVGGDNIRGHYINDIWNSADGVNWNKVLDSIPIPRRLLHMGVAFGDKMYVMGGEQVPLFGTTDSTHFSDIWSSSDGRNWQLEVAKAPFGGRGMIIGNLNMRDSLWIIGGGTYLPRQYYSDIWNSADGVNWNQKNAGAQFLPREYHHVSYFDDKFWVTGGYNDTLSAANTAYGNISDTWYSDDGVKWSMLPVTPWYPRHAHSVVADEESMILLGGPLFMADVWKLYRRYQNLNLNHRYDTLFTVAGVQHELYTERVPGFYYEWYKDNAILRIDNRTTVNQPGVYELKAYDVFNQEVQSHPVIVERIDFEAFRQDSRLFKGDRVYASDVVSSRILKNTSENDFLLINMDETRFTGGLTSDTLLQVQIKSNNILLQDTVAIRAVTPQLTFEGDFVLFEGDTVIASVQSLPGYEYKWIRNSSVISEDAKNRIVIAMEGTYRLEIWRNNRMVFESDDFVLVSEDAYVMDLKSTDLFEGDMVLLAFDQANQGNTFVFHWFKDGQFYSDNSTVDLTEPGEYLLEIYLNGEKVYTSREFTVSVYKPGLLVEGDSVLFEGEKTIISVPKLGGYIYHWFKNDSMIPMVSNPHSIVLNVCGCTVFVSNEFISTRTRDINRISPITFLQGVAITDPSVENVIVLLGMKRNHVARKQHQAIWQVVRKGSRLDVNRP